LYPPDELLQKLFFLTDVGTGATKLYEDAWAEVLAAQEKGD